MKNIIVGLAVVLLTSFFSPVQAHADAPPGWLLQPSLIYYFTTEGGNPPNQQNTTVTRELADILFGYSFGLIFLGANYNYDAILTSGSGNSTDSFKSIGGNLGVISDSFFLMFAYYFSSTGAINQGNSSTLETDFTKGSGFQIKLGYMFDIGSGWSLGPGLTYKSLTYASSTQGSVTSNSSFTYTTLVPEATIRYRF